MEEPVLEKLATLAIFRTWDENRKATEKTAREEASAFRKTEAEKEAAEKKAKEKEAIGDPEKDFQESVNSGISTERMQEKTKKLEAQLDRVEDLRRQLIAEEGGEVAKWESLVASSARSKVRAALLVADKVLKNATPVSSTPSGGAKSSSTKRER